MIVLVAMYRCKAGKTEEVLATLRAMAPLVKQHEPGCAMYQVSRAQDDPDVLMLYEQYVDQAALEAHRAMPHFKELIDGRVSPLLEKRERTFYELVIE
jgi:quinol monooxygenase YgiN